MIYSIETNNIMFYKFKLNDIHKMIICTGALVGIGSFVTVKLVKTFYNNYKNMFYYIEIPLKRNLNLVQKIQTFVSQHSYFGTNTILENGKRIIKTGKMITLSPVFSIIDIKISKKINEESNLTNDIIKIYLFSRKYDDNKLMKLFRSINNGDNMIKVYNFTSEVGYHWNLCKSIDRYAQPDYYPNNVIEKVENEVKIFLSSKDEYIKRGKNYKKSFLFYGPTGSGKTSMAKHLAITYGRNIYLLNPEDFFNSNNQVYSALKSCEGGIILMENIDKFFTALFDKEEYANISKLLTLLDGFYTPDDTIMIMTADFTGNLPDSLKRDGRLDCSVKFPYANRSPDVLKKVCENYFFDSNNIEIKGDITTSILIKNLEENINKQKIFIEGKVYNDIIHTEDINDNHNHDPEQRVNISKNKFHDTDSYSEL